MFSIPHMVVLFIIVLVVFGPQKLPELARSLGKLMAEFRKASTDFKGAFEEEMRGIERQAMQVEREKAAAQVAASATGISPAQAAESAPTSEPEPGQLPESTSLPEGPVVTPVAESVARGEDSPAGPAAAESETAPTEASDQEQHV